jgi:hypothetical protein
MSLKIVGQAKAPTKYNTEKGEKDLKRTCMKRWSRESRQS